MRSTQRWCFVQQVYASDLGAVNGESTKILYAHHAIDASMSVDAR